MIKGERDFQHYLKLDDMALTPSGVPMLKGITMKKGKLDLLPFNYASNFPKNERKDKVVHFFLADYLFERCWNQLDKQAELLKQFKAVLQPDFSLCIPTCPSPCSNGNIIARCLSLLIGSRRVSR